MKQERTEKNECGGADLSTHWILTHNRYLPKPRVDAQLHNGRSPLALRGSECRGNREAVNLVY